MSDPIEQAYIDGGNSAHADWAFALDEFTELGAVNTPTEAVAAVNRLERRALAAEAEVRRLVERMERQHQEPAAVGDRLRMITSSTHGLFAGEQPEEER